MRNLLFNSGLSGVFQSLGLLGLRLSGGVLMVLLHGWGKYQKFEDRAESFPDPLGVGSPISMALTIFAEVICASLITVGLCTRWAAAVGLFTMSIAAFVIHGDDPLSDKESALMYFSVYGALICLGAGRFSFDHMLTKR